MKTISKSKYLAYKSCPKCLWLLFNNPELAIEDPGAQRHIDDGKVVGEYAKKYFPNTVDVTSYDKDGNLDISNMIGLTNRYLMENKDTIAEASFSLDGLFCSIDLLHLAEDGYEIYEVKATTNVEKEHYIDAAFQKYVLEKKGLHVARVYILHLNNEYKRHGDIDVSKLFMRDDISCESRFLNTLTGMEDDLEEIDYIVNKQKMEPRVPLSTNCKECPFKAYCHKDIPVPSVLNINGLRKTYDYLSQGIVTYKDVIDYHIKLNKRQRIQIESFIFNKEVIMDKPLVEDFLKTIRYPIYHLDFESIQLPIPPCDGAWPYEQIPTQYSLHIEYEDGHLEHKEFLGDSIDPRRAIAEALCRDIPDNVCVLAYNKMFECGRLQELAEMYPDLYDHLTKMKDNVVDLLVPFKNGDYYHIKMGGSNSIKYVLPALCPNDPALDYHALPVVHNGGEAMDIYPKMLVADPVEKERIRDGLLKYCCLDTLAMVKVLRKLVEEVNK